MDSSREPEPVLTLFPAGMETTARETGAKQGHALRKVSDSVKVPIDFKYSLNFYMVEGKPRQRQQ